MGNDGGSIPKRSELVREAAKAPNQSQLKEKLLEQLEFLWKTDSITNAPLKPPVVSDCTGLLYNAETVISFVLSRSQGEKPDERAEQALGATVLGRRDYVEVHFEEDPDAGKRSRKSGAAENGAATNWICPVSRKPLGPAVKAVYLATCGHAFAAVALKEIKSDECPQCGKPYQANDVITLVPSTPEEVARLDARIKLYRQHGLSHADKAKKLGKKEKKLEEKSKKRKRHADAENDAEDARKKKHSNALDSAAQSGKAAVPAEA